MKDEPFEYVFPIEHGDIPASYVSLPEGKSANISWRELLFREPQKFNLLILMKGSNGVTPGFRRKLLCNKK